MIDRPRRSLAFKARPPAMESIVVGSHRRTSTGRWRFVSFIASETRGFLGHAVRRTVASRDSARFRSAAAALRPGGPVFITTHQRRPSTDDAIQRQRASARGRHVVGVGTNPEVIVLLEARRAAARRSRAEHKLNTDGSARLPSSVRQLNKSARPDCRRPRALHRDGCWRTLPYERSPRIRMNRSRRSRSYGTYPGRDRPR